MIWSLRTRSFLFQFMHLLRDATLSPWNSYPYTLWISIHASLTRCNLGDVEVPDQDEISIHASLTRCNSENATISLTTSISIHASLTRCNDWYSIDGRYSTYFNSCISYEMQPFSGNGALVDLTISIHASLTRCNCYILYFICDSPQYIVLS